MASSRLAALVLAASLPAWGGERRVDVGGFRLNVRCEGKGAPAVVFDAGAGDSLATWDWVAPSLKKLTRVCAYDRAGFGKSDPGPLPRTSERIAAELHELLLRARVPPPYVLVGHSFGGVNVRLFAARYPREVVGLVLVDATPEDYPEIEDGLLTLAEREKHRTMAAAAPKAFRDELAAMPLSVALVRAVPRPSGIPVIVLSASHADDPPSFREAWDALQRKMADALGARRIDARKSDHYIQYDQPELIVGAVTEIVAATRARRAPDPP